MKDLVVGLGVIGRPIYQLFSKNSIVDGYDLNSNLIDSIKFEKSKKQSYDI